MRKLNAPVVIIALLCAMAVSGTRAEARQLNIDEAKTELLRLDAQLLRLGAGGRAEVERRVAEKVNTAPKGEFETTKDYEARQTRAAEIRSRIEEEVALEQAHKKLEIERLMNGILAARFTRAVEARLGTYDADAQTFPVFVPPDGQRELLSVPLAEAREFKENFSRAQKVGSFALHVDGGNKAREYLLSAAFSYGGKVYQLSGRRMDTPRAMFMLYGNYSATAKRSQWTAEAEWWEDPEDATERLEAIPVFDKQFNEGGTEKFILVTGSVPEGQAEFSGCHACGTRMGVAVFALTGGAWGLEAGQKYFGTYGSFGSPPEVGLARIAGDRQALVLQSGYTAQGDTTETMTLLDRVAGVFKEVLSVQTAEDTSGAGVLSTPEDNVSYDSKVEYVLGGDPSHWDVRVTSRGTRGVRIGRRLVMRPFAEVKVYKFVNGEYTPAR